MTTANRFSVGANLPALAYHHTRMRFLVEAQFGGVSPRCLIVDSAATRRIAERAAADCREEYEGHPDFIGCFIREESLVGGGL